ncbi:MAG: Crp/Fnr family transcriptional regulator [Dechloromonas sp.]|nr:Crp/Fnr family transcriptional regulator [Dechloromonas sp.]
MSSALRQHHINDLLVTLSPEEITRLSPSLELLLLPPGLCLYEPGTPIQYAYFPTSAVISLLYEMDDGAMVEIAMVGNDGVVGVAAVLDGESTLSRAVVQNPGYAYRLAGEHLKREFQRGGPLQKTLLRYTQALLTEMAQTLVCVHHHSLEQQLCRWLLMRFDRLPINYLELSQESIANLLGVRRAAISEIAVKLRKAGLIHYGRGRIALLDRPGMEKRACGCYFIIRTEQDRLLRKAKGLSLDEQPVVASIDQASTIPACSSFNSPS